MREYRWEPGGKVVVTVDKQKSVPLRNPFNVPFAWGDVIKEPDPAVRTEKLKGRIALASGILLSALGGDEKLAHRCHMLYRAKVIDFLPTDKAWTIRLDEVHAAVNEIKARLDETIAAARQIAYEQPMYQGLAIMDGGVSGQDDAPDKLRKRIVR